MKHPINSSSMKNLYKTLLVCLVLTLAGHLSAQQVGAKVNTLYLATSTLNAGVDFRIASQWSGSILVGYNPWQFPSDRQVTLSNGAQVGANPKAMHLLVMPEVKWWPCKTFERHFIGLHGIYATYNVGGLPLPEQLKDRRYDGDLVGVGLSWGYQWAFAKRWGVELSLGAGYVYTRYKQYECGACGTLQSQGSKGSFAPTKAALNIIYYLK